MREVDGFTLVDYIKSSIEILMNMKIEDTNEGGAVAKNKNPYWNHHRGDEDEDYDPIEEDDEMKAERKRRRKEKKEAKKKKKEEGKLIEGAAAVKKIKAIPKIDNHTPTSSIIDLQEKLDQISSPTSDPSSSDCEESETSSSNVSIPYAHKEYERSLRQLEQECRNHIKVEQ